jgi:5-(carboxyamino)imidazole ribonucleotide mutase
MKNKKPLVAILMGSDSDLPVMKTAVHALKIFQVPHEMIVLSAHRAPQETAQYAKNARKQGIRVLIAGAGGAAHLAGVLAAHTELPVIGVPIPSGPLQGLDALYSIVQMPRGVPVATVAIGNAFNAGILAVQILGSGSEKESDVYFKKIAKYKEDLRQRVLSIKVPK